MRDKKNESVMIRLDEADRATLAEMATDTGIPAAQISRMALQAVLNQYRINRHITLPLKVRLSVSYGTPEYPLPPPPADLLLNDPVPPMGEAYDRDQVAKNVVQAHRKDLAKPNPPKPNRAADK